MSDYAEAGAASFAISVFERRNAVGNPRAADDVADWYVAYELTEVERVTSIEGVSIPGPGTTAFKRPAVTGDPLLMAGPWDLPAGTVPGDWLFVQYEVYVGGSVTLDDCALYSAVDFPPNSSAYLEIGETLPITGFQRYSYCVQAPVNATSTFSIYFELVSIVEFGADLAEFYVTNVLVEPGVEGQLPASYSEGLAPAIAVQLAEAGTVEFAVDASAEMDVEVAFHGGGAVILAAVGASGVGEARVLGSGKSTLAKVKAVGVGALSAFAGPFTGSGKLTIASPRVLGAYGLMPPVPPTPSAALTSTAHSLIGHISVTIGGVDYTPWAENLQFDSNVSGGYGACSMNLRPPTLVPAYDAAVSITGPGGLLWSGTVVNTPDITYTGENVRYEVVAEGPYRAYGRAEDFAWTSSDSDLGAWEQIDCQGWDAAAAGFEISSSVSAGLSFLSSDLDVGVLAEDGTPIEAAKAYSPLTYDGEGNPVLPAPAGYYANMPPESAPADFIEPKVLWSAHYYWIGRGLTDQRITGLKANAMYDLETPLSDALTVPNYDAGTPNAEDTWEWLDPEWVEDPPGTWTATVIPWDASYPDMDMWAELYGIDPPGSMWAGIYAIDNPRDLPVREPLKMLTHDSLIHKFEPHTKTVQAVYAKDEDGHYIYDEWGNPTFDVEAEAAALELNCDCKMLVFYSTYVVTQVPMWTGMDFDPQHVRYNDHHEGDTVLHPAICDEPLTRFGWYASNRLFTEGKQYITLADVKVLANSASGSGSADLRQALEAASGGGDIESFSLPEGASINIPPYATRLSAIQQLVGMVATPVYWGWDPTFFCVSSRGSTSFDATYPGVTVAASVKNDGTITSATVIYSGADDEAGAPEDRRVLAAWVPKSLAFDVNGDGRVGEDENAGLIDGSYVLHSADAAAAAAQSYIEERGVTGAGTGNPSLPQWEGTITLRGISGAAATKVATKVTAGDVTDAVVTAVSVDVDSDTVTLSLGGTGYAGRFSTSPGSPNSAVPSNSAAMRHILPYQTRR